MNISDINAKWMMSHSDKGGEVGAWKRRRNSWSECELHDLKSKCVMHNTYKNISLGTKYICGLLFTYADLITARSQKRWSI